MLRRINYGENDLIITFLTYERGKLSAIAKSAKKSVKRFSGILDLFSVIEVVLAYGRTGSLPILKEATLKEPFTGIRTNIQKTAYASYWAELINKWAEQGDKQTKIYNLFKYALGELDRGRLVEEAVSIFFQIRFLMISGLYPDFSVCSVCKTGIENIKGNKIFFDLAGGGIVCGKCASAPLKRIYLSKGTIKQLKWIENKKISTAGRIKLTSFALKEGLYFLEAFVPYHLNQDPKSLRFLQQIRKGL